MIDEDEIGWYVEPGDADALTEMILRIAADRPHLDIMGKRAREAALAKYSASKAIGAYRDLLEKKS